LIFDAAPPTGQQAPDIIGLPGGMRWSAPRSWSPDGRIIACKVDTPNSNESIGLYYVEERKFEPVVSGADDAVWLQDGSRIVFTRNHGIYLFDVQTKDEKLLLDVAPAHVGHYSLSLASDDRTIFFYQSNIESDIWLIDGE